MTRRTFVRTSLTTAALWPMSCAAPGQTRRRRAADPVSAAFDPEMERFMAARDIPGGALAVVKDGRLVYVRGYGLADRARQVPVSVRSIFRIASLSKPITAVAVLKLAEAGRLDLDAKAFETFPEPPPRPGTSRDPRLARVTIRQLLQHTGGWDRDVGFDPMFRPVEIARALEVAAPAGALDVIRYMLGRPLDFDPGTRYAYSNFGYCVLGRIIEHITGKPYESFVREAVLAPCRIRGMRLGATLEGRQAPDEVRYYMGDASTVDPVFPGVDGRVPWPYGGFHLEAMDAHGGWIASAMDIARFAAALDDPRRSPVLRASSFAALSAPPDPPAWRQADGSLGPVYYGCGWLVRPDSKTGRANHWHTGSLPGTFALLVRRRDGLSWAALFNQRSGCHRPPDTDLDPALNRAAAAVRSWPEHNLFTSIE